MGRSILRLPPLSDFAISDARDVAFDYANVPSVPTKVQAHIAGINMVGGDVVEVPPSYEETVVIAGGHVAMELCCLTQ